MAFFQMSFAFNWEIPETLLYAVEEEHKNGDRKPVVFRGSSLSQGRFLIDQFARTGDAFSFQLFEWLGRDIDPLTLHSKPHRLVVHGANLENGDLFTTRPNFPSRQFLDQPKRVDVDKSPFPGLRHLYSWLGEPFSHQVFPIISLDEQQTFRLGGRVMIPSLPDKVTPSRTARIFYFDPEMIVGDDGGD